MVNNVLHFILKYLSLLWLLLLPIKTALTVVLLLVMMDMVVGVRASLKEGYKITSRSLRRTVSKLLVYEIVIIVAFLIETYLLEYPITKAITGLVGIVEGKSFFENLYRITKIDFLKIIIDKLQLVYDTIKPSSSKDLVTTYTGKKNEEK